MEVKYGISGNNEVGVEITLNKGTQEEYLNACKYFGIDIDDESEE